VVSVTSEAAVSASFQIAPAKPAKPASQGNESFAALVDSNTPVENSGNDRATSRPQQQSASRRRTEDTAAAPDNLRSRDAVSADQPVRNISDDRDTTAENYAEADTDQDAMQQSQPKSGASKADGAKTIEKPASETTSAADGPTVADASAQQDAAALIIPNPVAVAIPVAIVPTNISPAAPASGNAAAPLAIAAAAIAATSSAAPAAPAAPSAQIESDAGAAASQPTSTAATASSIEAATTSDAAVTTEAAVRAPASEALAAPVKQQVTPTEAAAATDPALTVAVEATAAPGPKAGLVKAAVFTPTKNAASAASDSAPGTSDPFKDPSKTAASADAAQTNTLPQQQPTIAVTQEDSNGVADRTKTDAPASPSPATPATASADEHSLLAATAHAATNSSDTAVQATGTIQPQLASAAATVTPAAPLSVTLATNAAIPLSGLALEIAASVGSGKSRFEIRLDPADLGRIDVRIDVDRNGRVTSHLTVEKPETLTMLRQDAPQLQRQLDDAGFKTGNGGLQFSLRDQSSSGQNNGNETSRNAQRLIIGDEDTIPAVVAGRTYGRVLGSSSGVDIRV
jgi:flagellar hook-length control protein FliK